MAALRMTLEGESQLKRQLENLIKNSPKELRRALRKVGERKFQITQERVPVKKGVLKGSGKFRVMISGKKEDLRVTIVYGGPDAPYARRVHDTHKTQSKFLESVLLESVPTLGGELRDEIDLARAMQ